MTAQHQTRKRTAAPAPVTAAIADDLLRTLMRERAELDQFLDEAYVTPSTTATLIFRVKGLMRSCVDHLQLAISELEAADQAPEEQGS